MLPDRGERIRGSRDSGAASSQPLSGAFDALSRATFKTRKRVVQDLERLDIERGAPGVDVAGRLVIPAARVERVPQKLSRRRRRHMRNAVDQHQQGTVWC